MKPFTLRVPASTSNLGPGFDALSLALNLYLRLTVEPDSKDAVIMRGEGRGSVPEDATNLVFRVARHIAMERREALPSLRILVDNEIPLARGLGSSAAAIIAGAAMYAQATGDRLTTTETLRHALAFEGHPDNLAAALHGGLVAAALSENGHPTVVSLRVAMGVRCLVVIPEFELRTDRARAALPESYSRQDVVFNLQRASVTLAALVTGEWAALREGMRDRIHQPYRVALVPGLDEVLLLDPPGLIGVALSGAGPSVFAIALPEADLHRIGEEIVATLARNGVRSSFREVGLDTQGCVVSEV